MTKLSTASGIRRLSVSASGNASCVQRWDLLALDAADGTRSPVVLHSDDGARAVLVALHPGQSLGDHQVKETAWVVVLDGRVEIEAGDGAEHATAGTLLRFDPDERHAVRTESGARVLLLLAPWPGEGHFRGNEPAAR
jgi:quercetin dioxygenase-like cupin family protein